MPRHREELLPHAEKAAEREHGISDLTGTHIKHDVRDFTESLATGGDDFLTRKFVGSKDIRTSWASA